MSSPYINEVPHSHRRLTDNFSRDEFACKCCNECLLDVRLLMALERLRKLIGNKPIHVNSGYRCINHNRNVGGASSSKHLLGQAVDIRVDEMGSDELVSFAEKIPLFRDGGIGIYDTFVHVDVRDDGSARW